MRHARAAALALALLWQVNCGEEMNKSSFEWQSLPDLPASISGQFVGVSNEAVIVAGGSRFAKSLFEGGQKEWVDTIYVLEPNKVDWRSGFNLPHALAYGASVSTADGMICLGGGDANRNYAEVFRLRWSSGRIEQESLPAMPNSTAMAGAAMIGQTIYVMGGQESPAAKSALRSFWSLDLSEANPNWRQLEPWPGPGRILPVVAALNGSLYLFSGSELLVNEKGETYRKYPLDGYIYRPGKGWTTAASPPRPLVAAPCITNGSDELVVFGGDDGKYIYRIWELKDRHPGFARDILSYRTTSDTWAKTGSVPECLVTTTAARWGDLTVVPGGEDRPGHRSAHVFAAKITGE